MYTEKPIDIFLTWVDGADEEWLKEKEFYANKSDSSKRGGNDKARFESWDNLQYLFRAIEKNMPWVNKVYLITCGHLPKFLNINHPKLKIIKHTDYIPEEYLPTFNSNVIEMNLFRIEELSENFILFNDDTFPINPIEKKYYFKSDQVCDEAIERTLSANFRKSKTEIVYFHGLLNNIMILNNHFKKREVQKKNFIKWFHPSYGKKLLRNIALRYYYDFDYFTNPHEPQAYKKSTFRKIWELEGELLANASKNKFRDYTDISHYLVRYWQLCEGNFVPSPRKGKLFLANKKNYREIADVIREKRIDMICIGEMADDPEWDNYWPEIKREINAAFEEIFPNKSSFEL